MAPTGPIKAYRPTPTSSNSTSFASISLSDGTNYLFYYDADKNLACLAGKDAGIFSNTTVQPSAGITIQSSFTSPLAATAWENDQGSLKEVRVYHVDSSYYIKELCSTDGKNWYSGQFDQKNYKIAATGGLAATCGEKQGLKVFFADANNDGKIVEAYINTDTKQWESNVIQ